MMEFSTLRSAVSTDANTVRLRWRMLSTLAVWLTMAYLGIVLPLDKLFPSMNRWYGAVLFLVLSLVATYVGLRQMYLRAPRADELSKNVALLATVVLLGMVTGDIIFTVYSNVSAHFRADQEKVLGLRLWDGHEWDGEVMPNAYMPTAANFGLLKPGQVRSATTYGEHYYTALSQHPLVRDHVLELRKVEFVIDQYGLRNTDKPSGSKIFALGDSFCFGYSTSQEATFPVLLKSRLSEPVYNMGVSATSPMQQYLLLEYMLRTYPEDFKPSKLLWLIFEGNDLEDDYSETKTLPASSGLRRVFAGTVVEAVANIPAMVRKQSLIRLIFGSEIELNNVFARHTKVNHHELDGDYLAYPLYHSERFGYRLFRQAYLDRATKPLSYVLNHPNRPLLDETFRRMKALAQERHFDVTVVMVPSAARLYKDYFEDLPPISNEPHFIHYVEKLSADVGFGYMDLNALMAPFAAKELLYYRDDSHWNVRGHQIAAQLLAEHILAVHH